MSDEKGITLVEMMVSLSIFSMLAAVVFMSMSTFSKASSSTEATNQMKSCSQKAVNKIGLRLSESKRIFENTGSDTPFLARVAGIETILPGSRLPRIEETGSLSPGDPLFTASGVGNSLFFANTEFPEVLVLSTTCSVRIDAYVFNYYYLAQTTGVSICNTPVIRLMGWHSKEYADYTQLNVLSGNTRTLTVQALFNRNIRMAWDPTATDPSNAFYVINLAATLPNTATHKLVMDEQEDMTRFAKGIMWGRYRSGISPNTGGSAKTSQIVPEFGLPSGYFPSGFEVTVIGPRSAHRIFIRLVLIAEGPLNFLLAYENSVLNSARNLW